MHEECQAALACPLSGLERLAFEGEAGSLIGAPVEPIDAANRQLERQPTHPREERVTRRWFARWATHGPATNGAGARREERKRAAGPEAGGPVRLRRTRT